MDELKKYPPYQEVIEVIVDDVKQRGYCVFYSHNDLKTMLDIEKPTTIEEYEKAQFAYMNSLDAIRTELLEEHNICLENKKGDGYMVVEPDIQVSVVTDKRISKARDHIIKAGRLLSCVPQGLLTETAESLRLDKMKRVAFLRGAFRKRKFPAVEERKRLN